MKKILFLTTGGTIASVSGDNGLAPGMSAGELIRFLPENQLLYRAESLNLMDVDSSNMQPEDWVRIAEAVVHNYDDYDGIVITHGTDTLAYSSAALSYMLRHLAKPVILTGSQIPIGEPNTDAVRNIRDAARFACEEIGGVFVVFHGKVINGTRAFKRRTRSADAFESVNRTPVAIIDGDHVSYFKPVMREPLKELQLDASLCPDVCLLKLHPGTKPELFDYLKQHYKGIIIEAFGIGGVPFQGRSLVPNIRELAASGIAVVFTTQCLEEGLDLTIYEAGRKVNGDLIISAKDMNTEAIVAKLMWVLGKTSDLKMVKRWMETPIAGDLDNK